MLTEDKLKKRINEKFINLQQMKSKRDGKRIVRTERRDFKGF